MRDRLIELICENIQDECIAHCNHPYCYKCKNLADYLLANGVIVPPCKVGDKVYYIYWFNGKKIGEARVVEICCGECGFAYHLNSDYTYFDLQEKEVYLTKEEAEQALKGGGE